MNGHLSVAAIGRTAVIAAYLIALLLAGHRAPSTAAVAASLLLVWAAPAVRSAARGRALAASRAAA
jgi:hypothetical protein